MELAQLKTAFSSFFAEHSCVATALLALGSLSVLNVVYKTVVFVWQTFLARGKSLKKFGAKQGAWAVVTGATDGIGKEFAYQLGKAGFNVLLVARNLTTLSEVATDIREKHGVDTAIYKLDFATAQDSTFEAFFKQFKDYDIGVLVNNVGKSHEMPVNFAENLKSEWADIVNINVNGTLCLTYGILPGMISRKRGLIINVGSFSGYVPSPMLAVYSGTKSFVSTFSTALAAEVKPHNIVVEHVNTYFVVSKLSKIRKSSALIPQPGPYVSAVLSKIGLACGSAFDGLPASTTPYWSHAALNFVMSLLNAKSYYIKYTHQLHKSIRKRALAKAAREAKKD